LGRDLPVTYVRPSPIRAPSDSCAASTDIAPADFEYILVGLSVTIVIDIVANVVDGRDLTHTGPPCAGGAGFGAGDAGTRRSAAGARYVFVDATVAIVIETVASLVDRQHDADAIIPSTADAGL